MGRNWITAIGSIDMETVLLKIRRQDDPGDLPYWEKFEVPYEDGMTVAGALLAIRGTPQAADGNPASPVACDISCMEGACGSCTMVIGGCVRLACRTFVDDLRQPIVIEPLSKFPVMRDLRVDRSGMLHVLGRCDCSVELDGLFDTREPISRISRREAQGIEPYAGCILCGACVEACPQANERTGFDGAFVAAHIIALGMHPSGRDGACDRLSGLLQKGGVADCAGVGNCEIVCPMGLALQGAMGLASEMAARQSIREFFKG